MITSVSYLGKRVCITLFLIFSLSGCRSNQQWNCSDTRSFSRDYDTARMTLPAKNEFSGMTVQLVSNISGCKLYLDAECMQFPHLGINRDKAEVTFQIDNQDYIVNADRLQGGQRLLLPKDSQQVILDALQSGKTVKIHAGFLHTELPPL